MNKMPPVEAAAEVLGEEAPTTITTAATATTGAATTSSSTNVFVQHHRYVPCGSVSLQSDAPGWGQTKNDDKKVVDNNKNIGSNSTNDDDDNDGSNVNDDDDDDNLEGPICWKCKGLGSKQQKKLTTSKSKSSSTISCPVCKGNGRLPPRSMKSMMEKKKSSATGSMTGVVGVIKRARPNPLGFHPSGPLAYALTTMNNCNDNSYWVNLVREADNGKDCPVYIPTSSMIEKEVEEEEDDQNQGQPQPQPQPHQLLQDEALRKQPTQIPSPTTSLPTWLPQPGEQLVKLNGYWRILQRIGSHRWTTDDLVTAYVASLQIKKLSILHHEQQQQHPPTKPVMRYLDLGCGNGSVLQFVSRSIIKNGNFILHATGIEARYVCT